MWKRFWPRVPLVSGMLVLLAALCLSEHVRNNAGPTSLHCLSFPFALACAWSWPHPLRLSVTKAAYQDVIKASLHLFSLPVFEGFGSCVSVVLRTASFPQSMIEWPSIWKAVLLLLLTWTLNHWCFFLILKREHKSKRLAPASIPLGAEEEANLLNLRALVVTSKWSATEQPSLPSPDNIRGIQSAATVSPMDSFWQDKGKRESVQY